MKWRAKQLMRDDLAKSSKSRLPKESAETTTSVEGNASIDSSSNERLHRGNSQLRMDEFLTFPDSYQDMKQSRNLDGANVVRNEDLCEAWECQARVHRLKQHKQHEEVEELATHEEIDEREEDEIQVTKVAKDALLESEKEKVCIKVEYEKLNEEHANYQEEIKSLKFALQRTAEEYEQLHQRNDKCQSEIQSLKDAQAESSAKHNEEIIVKDREVIMLSKQCCLAQQQIKEIQLDVEQSVEILKKDFTQKMKSNLKKEVREHKLTKKRLREEESRREKVERSLQAEQELSVKKIETLTEELESSLAKELKKLADESALKINQIKKTTDKELLAMITKVDGLRTKLHQREVEIRGRVEEISSLMKKETKILSNIQRQQLDLESKNDNLKRLKLINKALLKEGVEQKLECQRKDDELSKLKSKMEATQKCMETTKNKLANLSKDSDGKQNKVAKKKKSNSALSIVPKTTEGVNKEDTNIDDAWPEESAKENTACNAPSQKACVKMENSKDILKKNTIKDKGEEFSNIKQNGNHNKKNQDEPRTSNIRKETPSINFDDKENLKGWSWFNILFIICFIFVVLCFRLYDCQGLFEFEMTTCIENVFGLLKGVFLQQ